MPLALPIRRAWEFLIRVTPGADAERDQRRLFLAKILLVSLSLSFPVGLGLLPFALNPQAPTSTQAFSASFALTGALLCCYFINRWSTQSWGALLFIVAAMCSTLWSAQEQPLVLCFMAIEMLLAMAVLRLSDAVALSMAGLLAHGLLLYAGLAWQELALPGVFNLTALCMLVTTQAQYRHWERQRLSQVQQSQEWFETTLSSIGDAVLTVDPQRRVSFMNAVAERLTGWSLAEARGQPIDVVFNIINEATGKRQSNPVDEVLASRIQAALANHTLLIAKDGVRRPIADSGAPIIGPEAQLWGVVLVFRDMTRELKLAAHLQHSHRLEALGQLAGGVAHDFNNLLTAISGGLELAIQDMGDGQSALEDLKEVRDACHQATGLTQQLLAFSRRQVMQVKSVALDEAVRRNQRLLRRLLRDDIMVKSQVTEPCWVLVDPVQLDQVIMNLCINAGDAMPGGGTLTMSVTRVEVAQGSGVAELSLGPYGRLRVQDTGRGIAEGDRARIFEPFFTTKEQDRGTGLGLATVYGIAQQSGGAITVESEVGRGTTFDVFLPAAEPVASEELAPGAENRIGLRPQQRRILVVEDDDLVRSLVKRVLSLAGYMVLEASTGKEALDLIDSGQAVDLLLSDIVMPEMIGPEVAAAIRERFQNLPVLFTSGYADEEVAQRGISGRHESFIAKPFSPQQLIEAVRSALDDHGSESSP